MKAMKTYDRAGLHRALDAVMDAAEYEVRPNRLKDRWGVWKKGEEFLAESWHETRAQAQAALKKLGGGPVKKPSASRREKEEPDVTGYPWETIQAAQRGLISGSQMGAHAQGVRKKRGF